MKGALLMGVSVFGKSGGVPTQEEQRTMRFKELSDAERKIILLKLIDEDWNRPAEDSDYTIGGLPLPEYLDRHSKVAIEYATIEDLIGDAEINKRDRTLVEAAKKANGNLQAMLTDIVDRPEVGPA
jgi:hypothetical protein